ncbi:MAG: hypothetical protein AB8G96_08100 [Phycisphaerales bacterium]
MRHLLDTIGGLWQLLRLGVLTGFRFRGPYWQWRLETALGRDLKRRPGRAATVHMVLDYARWVHRMRRLGG